MESFHWNEKIMMFNDSDLVGSGLLAVAAGIGHSGDQGAGDQAGEASQGCLDGQVDLLNTLNDSHIIKDT